MTKSNLGKSLQALKQLQHQVGLVKAHLVAALIHSGSLRLGNLDNAVGHGKSCPSLAVEFSLPLFVELRRVPSVATRVLSLVGQLDLSLRVVRELRDVDSEDKATHEALVAVKQLEATIEAILSKIENGTTEPDGDNPSGTTHEEVS